MEDRRWRVGGAGSAVMKCSSRGEFDAEELPLPRSCFV